MTLESNRQDLDLNSGDAGASAAPADPGPAPLLPLSLAVTDPDELNETTVGNLFLLLDKTVRARRLYQSNNPVYQSFIAALREAFVRLWSVTHALSVSVEEMGFRWEDELFPVGEGRDNLAFLFYKDGIRFLTFLPTFEEELDRFLEIVQKARSLDQNSENDMVTILWEREFAAFQYSYVDALADGLYVPDAVPVRTDQRVEPVELANDVAAEHGDDTTEKPIAIQQGRPSVASSILREDFQETMYFLDPSELDLLREEVEKEWRRELKADVLNALFDRIEDQIPDRQTEIVRILRQLMPAYLGRGDLVSASTILVELNALVEKEGVLGAEQAQLARELFAELSEPAVLTQLLRSLEEGAIDPGGTELGVFLRHLGSRALALLLRSIETTAVVALQGRLRTAVEQLGRAHPEHLVELVSSDDELISIGAARLTGQMALPAATPAIAKLLGRSSVNIRKAAVDALVQIKSGPALEALQSALDDEDRDVRVAAARGLGLLRYQPARNRLEAILQGGRMRDADLTEKIAFFEAFGAVANAESVVMLDKLLNGKNLLRQKQPAEIRACAAMALGRVGSPASRAALERASAETHPMVRNAVLKAMRPEVSAT